MKRLVVRSRSLVLVVALAVMAAMCTVSTAHAASPGSGAAGIRGAASHAAAASSTPCSFEPATTCQSTDPSVTQNVHYYGDQSGCTYVWDVSWGDGQSSPNLTNTDPPDGYMFLANHTYAAAGTYAISLTGQVTAGDCTANTFTAQFTLVTPPPPVAPGIHYSLDYSGHVTVPDPGTASSLDYTTATWTVPSVPCADSQTEASFWAGLGGIGGPVLMQAGSDAYCKYNGFGGVKLRYRIWWEEYLYGVSSEPPVNYGEDVSPGDVITATIAYEGSGVYTIRVDVNGTEKLLATASGPSGYPADSEVIVETPFDAATHEQILPLSHFGTLTFTDAHFNYASGGDHYTTHVWEARNASSGNLPETKVARTLGTWTVKWQRAGCNDSSCTG